MTKEIEKKYLIEEEGKDYSTKALIELCLNLNEDSVKSGKAIKQGYLPKWAGKELCSKLGITASFDPKEERLREKSGTYYFTIKGDGSITRDELEVKVTKEIFDTYWPMTAGKRVEKVRLGVPYKTDNLDLLVEIDRYTDRKLVVAEVEAKSEEEANRIPALGLDITEDKRYKNKNLAK